MSIKRHRVGRDDALSLATTIIETLNFHNLVEEIFIGGSIIRQARFVADIDIGIIPICVSGDDLAWWDDLMGNIFNMFHISESEPEGFKFVCGKEILRLSYFGVQVDIWLAEERYWGPMCMFIAGNAKLNAVQRIKAKKQGVRLSSKGLFTLDGEDLGKFETEKKVYDFLNWKWVDYPDRNI